MNNNDQCNFTIGPTHYEGWTCRGCAKLIKKLNMDNYYDYFCGVDNKYLEDDDLDTPNWCPYIKSAIINRVMEV